MRELRDVLSSELHGPGRPGLREREHPTHIAEATTFSSCCGPSGSNPWLLLQAEMLLLIRTFLLLASTPGSWVSATP